MNRQKLDKIFGLIEEWFLSFAIGSLLAIFPVLFIFLVVCLWNAFENKIEFVAIVTVMFGATIFTHKLLFSKKIL